MSRSSACVALLAAAWVWLTTATHAQTLQQRKPSPNGPPASSSQPAASSRTSDPSFDQAPRTDPRLALPAAAEGEYRWGETGEVIQLYVEGSGPTATLHGYLTRRSDRHDSSSAPMTFAFAQAATHGDQLSFATRHIHGDWYSFQGTVARGVARSTAEDGYYLLNGTLQVHLSPAGPDDTSASEEPVTRQVSLKLLGSTQHAR